MAQRVIEDYPNISVNPENIEGKIDFTGLFKKAGPIHVEVGSGKGTFLVNQGKHQPEINFFGMEWANKYYRLAVDRIGRWGIENVRLMRHDAAYFLHEHVADGCVSWFHIYFPDPWPKARHNKRRFFSEANMQQMLRCLETGGVINAATDHLDYFEQMQRVVNAEVEKKTVEIIDFTRAADAREGEMVGTNFERKYKIEGRPTYSIACKKIGG